MAQLRANLTITMLATAITASIAVRAVAAAAGDPTHASEIFVSLCVKCHGLSGKGDGPACPVLQIKPGDFTDCNRMKNFSDEMLFKVIKHGGGTTGLSRIMTGFGEGLQDSEIADLVTYIRGFCAR